MQSLRTFRDFYNRSYDKRPILTLCVTNGILGALSDTLAQGITHYDYHVKKKEGLRALAASNDHTHRLHLDDRLPNSLQQDELFCNPPPSWEPSRTLRFAVYNFSVAPLVGKWFMFLDKFFPMPVLAASASKAVQKTIGRQKDIAALKRMVTDQVLFAPAGLTMFFTIMGFIETKKWEGVQEKFRDAFLPALAMNYKVWPVVQLINFKVMPLQYRLPFVSSLGIIWNAYLSWINNASKQKEYTLEHVIVDDGETKVNPPIEIQAP
ncbi:hypothetical protein CLU79DRAFT_839594 [Phycomyces nitens]|nr:hypothetical protein CLU79DRAFT_839594 [Phycomyces nitens]